MTIQYCRNCGAKLDSKKDLCPICGAPVLSDQSESRYRPLRILTHAILGFLLIIVVYLYGYFFQRFLPLLGVLRFSPLVSEAILLVNEHQGSLHLLGGPIEIGWFVRGYILDIGAYRGESELRIPVNGSKKSGTIFLRAGNGQGPWIYTELKVSGGSGETVDLFEHPPDQKPENVTTSRRVFLIPLGDVKDLSFNGLPQYYQKKYGVSVDLLPPIALDSSVRDLDSDRVVSEKLEELMRHQLPHLANDESKVLIGITDEDMLIRALGPSSMYNSYTIRGRIGVVSTFLLRLSGETGDLVRARALKLISRDIGVMAFQLPQTSDPTSVLARAPIGPVPNIDLVTENFEGLGPRAMVDEYRIARNAPSYEPELLPIESERKPAMRDGRYPCLLMKRSPKGRIPADNFTVSIEKCQQETFLASDLDEIEIDLRSGEVKTRKTDFFLAGDPPVAVTRCYGVWNMMPYAFGGNTSLSWDMYPFVQQHSYNSVDLVICDGSKVHYERISKGLGFANALYEHRLAGTPFSGSRIKWTANGWKLTQSDGTNILFPGTQNSVRGVDGAMLEFHGSKGQAISIERDRRRNLKRIRTPSQRQISFDYDSRYRVIEAFDDRGKTIHYGYDIVGRLIQVRSTNLTQRFQYLAEDLTSIDENGHRLIEFRYLRGRLQEFSLIGGHVYKIGYERDTHDRLKILQTSLTLPDGSLRRFKVEPQ
jgi:YD repeat-containing protein